MARSMKLFLIRHGETVDNIAQVYAGSTDSALTNHGYQQATRLGLHLRSLGLTFTHFFSSHLQRAVQTASKIREAQLTLGRDNGTASAVPEVVQLPLLMEKDFGSMEGKKSHSRLSKMTAFGRDHRREENRRTAGFADAESKASMARRADTFLDEYLMPLLDDPLSEDGLVVAIVSHGIFLSTLWKSILLRLPLHNVFLSPGIEGTVQQSLEHLGGWSNTGYLELYFTRVEVEHYKLTTETSVISITVSSESLAETSPVHQSLCNAQLPKSTAEVTTRLDIGAPQASRSHNMQGWSTLILRVNSKDHLQGLKRARGGVGSSRYDASQRTIESFFKRRKVQ